MLNWNIFSVVLLLQPTGDVTWGGTMPGVRSLRNKREWGHGAALQLHSVSMAAGQATHNTHDVWQETSQHIYRHRSPKMRWATVSNRRAAQKQMETCWISWCSSCATPRSQVSSISARPRSFTQLTLRTQSQESVVRYSPPVQIQWDGF